MPLTISAAVSGHVQSGTTQSVGLSSLTPQAGDIGVVFAMGSTAQNITCATSGWAAITGVAVNNANMSAGAFWHRYTAGTIATNPTITYSAAGSSSNVHSFAAYLVKGAITTGDPFYTPVVTGSPTNSTTPTIGALASTIEDNTLAVVHCLIDDDTAFLTSPPPTSWTLHFNQGTTQGGDARHVVLTRSYPTPTAITQTNIGTISTSEYWRDTLLVFRELVAPVMKNASDTASFSEAKSISGSMSRTDIGHSNAEVATDELKPVNVEIMSPRAQLSWNTMQEAIANRVRYRLTQDFGDD